MTYSWHDALGIVGVVIVLFSYLLLQMNRVTASAPWFSAVNAIGALLILASLVHSFNLPAFIIESAWFFISIYGFVRALGERREKQT